MNENQSVVSSEWLVGQLDNPDIVVVDCRFQLAEPQWGEQQYQRSHIPGAYYLDLEKDLSASVARHGGRHPLPETDLLAQKLSGISNQTLVVAYDDSRFAFAARLWWLLRYLGHERVALLNGCWQGWLARNYPVSHNVSAPRAGHFLANPQSNWIVDRETLNAKKDLSSVILIDSRDGDRYRGDREPIDPIAGHIRGALNSPWQLVTDEQGYLVPLEGQRQLWAKYQQADEIIVYCGSGVTACVNLFSWHLISSNSAEIVKAKLYPGGWSDWCSYLT
jgi:thiosulfate/3-mercaptopyruvate sulfurtransferase